jgi:hypothetical protein
VDEDAFAAFDVESVYRMIALACAAITVGKTEEHTHVMAVADSFLEYIDQLMPDDDGIKFTLDKGVGKKAK